MVFYGEVAVDFFEDPRVREEKQALGNVIVLVLTPQLSANTVRALELGELASK